MNWRTRYGHDTLDELTPKQRKRATKKENAAESKGPRYQRALLRERREAGAARRATMTATPPKASRFVGAGALRAKDRLARLFGKDAEVLFDERGHIRLLKDKKGTERVAGDES